MDVHQRRQEIVTITTGSKELDRALGGEILLCPDHSTPFDNVD